ncbi:MAG: glycoside hydrolase family 3 protein, partial [Methanococcaceae archaeon]
MNNFNYIRSFSLPIVLLAIMISGSFLQVNAQTKLYGDTATEKKIDSLLTLMTLEEKIGQVTQLSGNYDPTSRQNTANEVQKQAIRSGETGSFLNVLGTDVIRQLQEIAVNESRLKIPLIFGLDVIHGYKTTFPVPIAEACTWDPSLVEMSSHIQAMEATAAGINWTFAPMVDIARDPRWGRIVEGNGEDTYMGTIMTAARVKGFQGNDLKSATSLLACAKHFAAYGAAEGGRDYNNVDMSERTLREIYLPPFKSAVEAGAGTLMCSFNEIAGVPSSANRFLLTDILRKEWKFEGFVVSDWNSIAELVNHGIAPTQKDAAGLALNAGLDMDMASSSYQKYLIELIKEKKIKQAVLDESVRRVLRIKYQTGLFENPFKNCNPDLEKSVILSDKNKEAALEVAHKSIVLLKNEN